MTFFEAAKSRRGGACVALASECQGWEGGARGLRFTGKVVRMNSNRERSDLPFSWRRQARTGRGAKLTFSGSGSGDKLFELRSEEGDG